MHSGVCLTRTLDGIFTGTAPGNITLKTHGVDLCPDVQSCVDCNDGILVKFRQSGSIVVAWTYYKVSVHGDPIIDSIQFTDIWGMSSDPSGGLTTGFDPIDPEMVPLSDEEFISHTGATFPAPIVVSTLANLPALLPGFDLSIFTGDPNSIVYVAQSGDLPAADFICPEPSGFWLLAGSLLAIIVRVRRRAAFGKGWLT